LSTEPEWLVPASLDEALALRAERREGATVVAGGTFVGILVNSRLMAPEAYLSLQGVAGLDYIRADGDLRIGALTTHRAVELSPVVSAGWPALAHAFSVVASPRVRNQATVGGVLADADYASDPPSMFVALGARAVARSVRGEREVPVENVVTAPGRTSLARGEFVVAFRLPKPRPKSGDAYLRFIPRTEMDIAVVGCGVSLAFDDAGVCTHARVGLGAVAPTPLLVADAAKALIGTRVDDKALAALSAAASAACKPIDDKRGTIAYRIKVSGVLARRAATIALERARGRHG